MLVTKRFFPRAALFALALFAGANARGAGADEAAFMAENDAAMSKMMAAMQIEPSGDVDRDFVDMMVPHHQGAIDMARTLLRYGRNEQLRRMAQGIIVTQHQEIAVMRMAVGLPPANASSVMAPADAQPMARDSMHMQGQ